MTGPAPRAGAAPDDERPSPECAAYPAHPDAELLDDVAAGSLRQLAAMRPSFRLPDDVATDADPNLTLKPLGELAELTHVVISLHPVPEIRDAAADLFAFAWKETRGGELFADLVRGEPLAVYPVELYGVFARAGLRHPGTEELIAATTSLRRWRVPREDHTRTLNVLNAERRIGLPPHADFAAVLARTGLGQLAEPWALDRKAAYGITHDAFHATDWGRTPGGLPAPQAEYLRLWLPAWTDLWLDERLWDLAGEFLAVSAVLPGAPYDPVAWRRLAAARAAGGELPEVDGPPPPDTPPGEVFTACYHSTLVAAFAATLARTRPPTLVPRAVLVPRESEAR
ncbi:DUF6895 family protein [Actinacidiphila yeochonensis]|uniref:DUF6895 family protein n=1 Tax=Actinacidiphila yeochonensis TaxID=89050 RepID=UPI000B2681D2|nr:hypothetical protein [Actinacidiphila yeochonensis]